MTDRSAFLTDAGSPVEGRAAFQKRYDEHVKPLLLSGVRIYAALSLPLILTFIPFDRLFFPQAAPSLLWVRIIGSLAVVVTFLLTTRGIGVRHPFLLSLLQASALALYNELLIIRAGNPFSLYYAGHCLVNLGCGLLLPWTLRTMLCFSFFHFGVYVLPNFWHPGPFNWPMYASNTYFLFSTMMGSCWAAHIGTKTRERELRLRMDLEGSLQSVREADEAKTRFFANMSHELRTPLTLMIPPLEDLLTNPRYALTREAKELLEIMSRNGKRLLKLINQLLELSRLDAGKLQLQRGRSNLGRLAGEVAARFKPFAEGKGLSLLAEGTDVPDSFFDAERMELVVQNLLSNAIKFTPSGGRVTMRLSADGKGQTLEVADTGIGVDPADQGKIFDRFSQADGSITRRFGGTGIGLALVKELVELHGGRIRVESSLGRGARFAVWIPALPVEGGAPAVGRAASDVVEDWEAEEADAAPAAAKGGQPLVLVVDDNRDLRALLKTTLEPQYRVALAKDGDAGLAAAQKLLPDVVISDVMMPGKSGNELAAALKSDPRTAVIPVILLTAKLDAGSLVEGLAAGADDYVRKPFSPVELLARIRGQLRLRDLTQRLVERWTQGLLATVSAGVAQEINTPSSLVLGELERVRREAKEGRATLPVIAALASSSLTHMGKINRIVQGLCSVAGKGRGVEEVDVRRMVEDVLWLVRPRAWEYGVSLAMGDPPDWLRVKGDGRDLRRALLGVAMNAVEAAAQAAPDKREVWIDAQQSDGNGMVDVEVRDSGSGIPREVLDSIFEPFFTTKSGLGLGLSIARHTVQLHGGNIRVDSVPGRTSFTLSLPSSVKLAR